MQSSRCRLKRLAAATIAIAALASAARLKAEMLIEVREENGQLRFYSNLVPGNHNVPELPVRGRSASAQILVEAGDGPQRPVRSFRVESWQDVASEDGRSTLRAGFSANLEPTSVPDRFRLRLEVHHVHEGVLQVQTSILRRGFGMYYLSFAHAGTSAAPTKVVGRAKSLLELMLESPQAYKAFEEAAQACSLPSVGLVPQSRFSPTVIEAVMGDAIVLPTVEASPDWARLVAELDSDDYEVRAKASESLLAAEGGVTRYLQKLRPEELSLEQRARIAYIIRRLTVEMPPVPQPLAVEELRALQMAPPNDWLARLVMSSEEPVRKWALDRLHRQGLLGELPPNPSPAERRELFDALTRQISPP